MLSIRKVTRAALSLWSRKRSRQQERQKTKRADDRIEFDRWRAIRESVYRRDFGRSRASGARLQLQNPNPFTVAHCHHIVYRSAGGTDTRDNLVTLTPEEHFAEHDGLLEILGDPNYTLTFRSLDRNGRLIREWTSPCPT